jgi:hypothetical protein
MQVPHSLTLPTLLLPLEQHKQGIASGVSNQPLIAQIAQRETAIHSLESIKQAEHYLRRHHSERGFSQVLDHPRDQHAVKSYQMVQSGQERDYVSEVLGIDVYA